MRKFLTVLGLILLSPNPGEAREVTATVLSIKHYEHCNS
jgi:hypothetical protein